MSREPKTGNAQWDQDDSGRYRRPRRPVEVRRRSLWKQGLRGARRSLPVVAAALVVSSVVFAAHDFAATASVFRLPGLEAVEVANVKHVPVEAVRARFAADVGQSIFSVPLNDRRRSVEEILWVQAATVQRLLPNRLRISVQERIPVAFLRQGQSLWLIDGDGVILPSPESASYSFPVLIGLSENLTPAQRQARVQLYLDFIEDLDRKGKRHSAQLSEIDLSDTNNIRASVTEGGSAVWLYFGRGRYQQKYEAFLRHRSVWQQSGEAVRSVDLRYRGQIVLNPGGSGPRGAE